VEPVAHEPAIADEPAVTEADPEADGSPVTDTGVATLRRLLEQPEGAIDLARAKVAIDRLVDPTIDAEDTLRQLDQWAATVRARFPPGASNRQKVDLLVSTLYEPGPWNDHRPFDYDFTDPYGKDVRKSLLANYLASRLGQCVIMPTAFVLLGQKLGLPTTMTTAPYHLIAKYGDEEQGEWTNLDATSGLFHDDGGYIHALSIPEVALENDVFLRPYTQRESVALFATAVLVPHTLQQGEPERALEITELILKADPKDVVAMTLNANAYALMVDQRFRRRYPLVEQIPLEEQDEFRFYNGQIVAWRGKAEALGWREWTDADWKKYLDNFNQQKSQ